MIFPAPDNPDRTQEQRLPAPAGSVFILPKLSVFSIESPSLSNTVQRVRVIIVSHGKSHSPTGFQFLMKHTVAGKTILRLMRHHTVRTDFLNTGRTAAAVISRISPTPLIHGPNSFSSFRFVSFLVLIGVDPSPAYSLKGSLSSMFSCARYWIGVFPQRFLKISVKYRSLLKPTSRLI